jgi:fructose/tagatose bisphosphate aldolase
MQNTSQNERYAVGYFESWNLESMEAVINAAEEERSPVIIGFNGSLLTKHKRKLEYYAALGKVAAEKTTVPAALLLDCSLAKLHSHA